MNYYLSKLMTYHEVHRMHREGISIRRISEHLGLNWRTVKKLLSKDDRSYQKELEAPGYFGAMMPVISVKPCHLKDHTII